MGDAMVRVAGLKACQYWFWFKSGQNQANVETVSSVEILTVASHSDPPRKQMDWNCLAGEWDNPLNRSNVLSIPTTKTKRRSASGGVINQHENPPDLMWEFTRRWGNHGCTLLIIGGGTGSDGIGALKQSGVNLIIIEPDEKQYQYMVQRYQMAASGKGPDATYLGAEVIGDHGIYIGKADQPSGSEEGDEDNDGKATEIVVKCFACALPVTDGDGDEEDEGPVAYGLCNQCECPSTINVCG